MGDEHKKNPETIANKGFQGLLAPCQYGDK
jgi:hypothetical protein